MIDESDLKAGVAKILREHWDSSRRGRAVPSVDDLLLNQNHGIRLDACVLYADMSESTLLVDTYKDEFAAEVYKTYMLCAGKMIADAGGVITAYDGDRVMAIFLGEDKESAATIAALRISYALDFIISPAIAVQYPNNTYVPGHTVGIDASEILAARIGIRGGNDIVWVGKAANHAAKLCSDDASGRIRITEKVWNALRYNVRVQNGGDIWVPEGQVKSGVLARSSSWWFAPWYNP
ncbi:adenylate/guanylate cyclase domain-containing protein [Dyella sp.]|uniref:adenylate/guanylate cyclase domain-containing protein n=1 Tax=Dyella sp. TaxID=1869338 RepID=UPI00283B0400|nr:adenylate/guanylate cyclase domain-containing protein [Dyella sp.]MDR3444471.1 adenylate/guanylate cyclase domain-containing protein [Dyella sp.]